jgi:uncharacterized protein (TIGR03067 family)
MRFLKPSVLVLAMLAGACGGADTSQTAAPSSKHSAAATEPEIPLIVFKDLPPQELEPVPSKEAAAQRELQQLRGTWLAVDIQHDGGQEMPAGGLKWVIYDDRYQVWIGKQNLETNRFTLDPTRRPRTIHMRHALAGSVGRGITGIYDLQDDTLKVCYDLTGREYPKEFSAPKAARRIVYVFRRQ